MEHELSQRKNPRLPGFDYSNAGCYFVTVCTQNRVCRFSVGAAPCGRPNAPCGRPADDIVERWLLRLPEKFQNIALDKYVVMPNHIHAILRILAPEATGGHAGPPLQQVVDWYKTMTTNEWIRGVKNGKLPSFQKHLWQRGYYDHIIRNEEDYLRVWQYIDENPSKWAEDEYYAEA